MTTIFGQDKPSLADLAHHGVKGMKWGVRRDRSSSSAPSVGSFNDGKVTMKADGSILIKPGATLQRLSRSNGQSLPMKDITYASVNAFDNARYIKVIGGKGFFGGGRDQILSIKATKTIKAPSVDEATKMHSEMMLGDKKFREKNTNVLGATISSKELERIRQDPVGKTAAAWYWQTNVKLTFGKDFDPDAPYVQKAFRDKLASKGFNAVRDENDVNSGVAKSPIIIFNPHDSLRVTSVTPITDTVRKANKDKLKQYKKMGDQWVQDQLYTP